MFRKNFREGDVLHSLDQQNHSIVRCYGVQLWIDIERFGTYYIYNFIHHHNMVA